MAFVVRSERRLGGAKTACGDNIGPGSYAIHESGLSAKKKMSV